MKAIFEGLNNNQEAKKELQTIAINILNYSNEDESHLGDIIFLLETEKIQLTKVIKELKEAFKKEKEGV